MPVGRFEHTGRNASGVVIARLRRDLAHCFERYALTVRPLSKRRNEIPSLAGLFLARFAAVENLEPPHLAEATTAFLWRQPWPDN